MTIEQLKPLIIAAAIAILIFAVISYISKQVKKLKRKVNSTINSAIRNVDMVREFSKAIQEAQNEGPQVKSIGGSTKMYLDRIHKDFPDFHSPDAENAVKTFVNEYINIKYGTQKDFIKSKIDGNVLIDTSKESSASISNIIINAIAIYDYTKTRDYATVTYKVSVGYDKNGSRVETRYEVNYTLQLYKDDIAMASMVCPNCGGTYDSTADAVCPYCDAPIIKDTVMTWVVTSIKEIG